MDDMTNLQRGYTMSMIRSTNTYPERRLRSGLFKRGYRYKKNVKKLPGCPDIVLKKYKTVIFVNGCFWHHHEKCYKDKYPETNREYWKKKLQHNAIKDAENKAKLNANGWSVITVWECEIKKDINSVINIIIETLMFFASRDSPGTSGEF